MTPKEPQGDRESSPTLVTLIPQLMDETGHYYSYAKALERACRLIGWSFRAALPRNCRLTSLPQGWSNCLYADRANWRHQVILALRAILRLSWSIRAFLRSQQQSAAGNAVLFIDSFDQGRLAAVLLSILFLKNRPSEVWIFCRYPYRRLLMQGRILKLLSVIMQKAVSPGKVVFLTDSELLKGSYARLLSRPVNVMPIPHTNFLSFSMENASPPDRWTLWWPGEPREHKGLDIIKRMADSRMEGSNRFKLIVAGSAGIDSVANALQLQTIACPQPPEDYAHTLKHADIILLPYDSDIYAEATSGIFVEAVVAGKMPLVSRGTWMAFELKKFDLDDLVIDWDDHRLFSRIEEIVSNTLIRERLKRMRFTYNRLHNEKSYADRMLQIFQGKGNP